MKITLSVDDYEVENSEEIRKYARHILMDALAEFQYSRGPTDEEYVEKRYPDTPNYKWLNRTEKVSQVVKRKQIAEILRCSDIEIE